MKKLTKVFLVVITLMALGVSWYYFTEGSVSFSLKDAESSAIDTVENKVVEQLEDKSFTEFEERKANRQFLNELIESYLKELPSPTQVLFKLKSDGLVYNESLINDFNKFDSYLIISDKSAINLGVYASDIAYLSAYGKLQEVINYLNVSRQMSDRLGVTSAFDIKIKEEFIKNFENKKKIESLINRSIQSTTDILRTDDRTKTAILLLAGAYIEGLYISSNMVNPNSKVWFEGIEMIKDQENSLDGIIDLLNQLDSNERMDSLLSDFENLKEVYQDIHIGKENEEVDPESIAAFVMEVNKIRVKMVSPSLHL